MKRFFRTTKLPALTRIAVSGALFASLLSVIPTSLQAQAVTLYGSLSNFDVYNETGQEAYGFQIELDGVASTDVQYTFGSFYIRYGYPTLVDFPGGVYVRYLSPWDFSKQQFVTGTIVATNPTPTGGHECFTNLGSDPVYDSSGCEHFGVGLTKNPTNTIYNWLVADPTTPGSVMTLNPPVAIPAPIWALDLPPEGGGVAPIVRADVGAPALRLHQTFGDAEWVKVYKDEQPQLVGLNDLLSDNPIVPDDPTQQETNWFLLQSRVGGSSHTSMSNQGQVGSSSHAVVRRYEYYQYTGAYDPSTHEALCLDGLCETPAATEVGNIMGANMAAANLNIPASATLSVSETGNGQVVSSTGGINCGRNCSGSFTAGASVTLTSNASSGSMFANWGGACSGTQNTCTLSMDQGAAVTAVFVPIFNLSVSHSGKGNSVSSPAGINCGNACSVKFSTGTSITLTATPAAGSTFVNWTGGCTGTALTCTLVLTKDTSVQPNFK